MNVYMGIPKSSIRETVTTRWGTFHLLPRWGEPDGDWGIAYYGLFISLTEDGYGYHGERNAANESKARAVFQRVITSPVDPILILAEASVDNELNGYGNGDYAHLIRWAQLHSTRRYKQYVTNILRQHYPDAVEIKVGDLCAKLTFIRDGKIVRQNVSFGEHPRKTSIGFIPLWKQSRHANKGALVRLFRMRLKAAIAAEAKPYPPPVED